MNSYCDSKNSCSIKKIEEMAEQEDSEAQYTLSEYYYKQRQLSEAFIWYERASDNGNSNALYKKSIMECREIIKRQQKIVEKQLC